MVSFPIFFSVRSYLCHFESLFDFMISSQRGKDMMTFWCHITTLNCELCRNFHSLPLLFTNKTSQPASRFLSFPLGMFIWFYLVLIETFDVYEWKMIWWNGWMRNRHLISIMYPLLLSQTEKRLAWVRNGKLNWQQNIGSEGKRRPSSWNSRLPRPSECIDKHCNVS